MAQLLSLMPYQKNSLKKIRYSVAISLWCSMGLWYHSGQAQDKALPLAVAYRSSPEIASSTISSPNHPKYQHEATQEQGKVATRYLKKSDRYFVLPPCPVNQYSSGEIIAVPKDQTPVLSATLTKGNTPAGTTLFPNGCLVVVDPSQLNVGTYRFSVETSDQEGKVANHSLTVKLKPSGKEDTDAMYAVRQPKPLDQYVRGDALATSQDRDGAIVRSEFVKGTLPTGTSLTSDGRIVVDDPTQLQAGQYAAWIATEDERGGTTLFIITLMLQ